jgi:hypothetical protein
VFVWGGGSSQRQRRHSLSPTFYDVICHVRQDGFIKTGNLKNKKRRRREEEEKKRVTPKKEKKY